MEKKHLPPHNRRLFLKLSMTAAIGAGAYQIHRMTRSVGLWTYTRWTARSAWKKNVGRPQPVAVAKCPAYGQDVVDCLRDLWQLAEMPDVSGKRVLVKPNLIDYLEGIPVTTAPSVVGAVVQILTERGAGEVVVGDGPGFRRDAWPIVDQSGLAQELAIHDTAFIDLNYDDPGPVRARDGWFRNTNELWLPRHAREADLIVSVPKLKCHHWTGVSLGMKNLFGIVPGCRYGWPKNMLHMNGIPLSICGLYQSIPEVVTVADGIIGMEGDGPLFGSPVEHGLLAVGSDAVAVDVACADLMGFDVEEVDHLALADVTGLGQATKIELRGTSASELRRQYRRPPSIT